VLQLGAQGVVARLSLVMGLPVLGTVNSFLAKMVASLKSGSSTAMPSHEIRTPVDVITVGRALLELAAGDYTGIAHLAGNDSLSRLEMGRRIAARFGFSPELVVPAQPSQLPGRAPRPRDVSLDNRRTQEKLRTPMLSPDAALSLILEFSQSQNL
jgi:dTDP-4-dehydrorhamnose reductase